MLRKEIAVGVQDFEKIRERDAFYIDKTDFIREWWDGKDDVTLITRPRRFGKTLNMSMLNCFFSNKYRHREDLFCDLVIWRYSSFRKLQGQYPVLFLSFAGIKQITFEETRRSLNELIAKQFNEYDQMMQDNRFTDADRSLFYKVSVDMDLSTSATALHNLCDWLFRYYGKRVLIFLDEYDTPLQEAYVHGFWDELTAYLRAVFNNTFKTNPSLERAILTGITRVSKESIFSDLNNLEVITTTSEKYATAFGFTENEVFQALMDQGFGEEATASVKQWYDGFSFGKRTDIYNPWSVTAYLDKGKLDTYWANTSGNDLVGHLLRTGSPEIKMYFEQLLAGQTIDVPVDEQVVFSSLDSNPEAIWSLLLASGYLKVEQVLWDRPEEDPLYRLSITNLETKIMFASLVKGWFRQTGGLSRFVSAMLQGDVKGMNRYLNDIALSSMSYFDTGKSPSSKEPENFYHGLVLGLLVENASDYIIKSNRESGYGRYDIVLEPADKHKTAVIMEFKVFDAEDDEKTLEDTANNALQQIEEKKYETNLVIQGISQENILKYGVAFRGKVCCVKKG